MSETASPSVADVVNEAEGLAASAGVQISSSVDSVVDGAAHIVDLAAGVAAKEFNIDLSGILKGLSYLFLGATALVTVFRASKTKTSTPTAG